MLTRANSSNVDTRQFFTSLVDNIVDGNIEGGSRLLNSITTRFNDYELVFPGDHGIPVGLEDGVEGVLFLIADELSFVDSDPLVPDHFRRIPD